MYCSILFTVILSIAGQLTEADDQQLLALTSASSNFSQALYHTLAVGKDNVVYSPYSIHSALTLSYYGARGQTANEMAQTLSLTSLPGSTPHEAYHDLIGQMSSVKDVELNSANALFLNPNMPVDPDFITEASTDYLASASNFDLEAVDGPEKAINDFVADRTEHMIQEILPKGTIDGNTVMILINSVFFNGTWDTPFEPYNTQTQDFYQLGGATSQVEMMEAIRVVNIKRDNTNGVDVAELPFLNPRFSMYIALPQKVDGITDLENNLVLPGKVDELFDGLVKTSITLKIPKFKVETSLDLKEALISLGMATAFDMNLADFSGICPLDGVYISKVLHKAMIEVDESGTVAAASTAVVFPVKSFQLPPPDSFEADHPFIFFLRDNATGQILFQGKFSG